MALDLPPALQWLFKIIGCDWPDVDEDRLAAFGDKVRAIAPLVRDAASNTAGTVSAVSRTASGPAMDAFTANMRDVVANGLPQVAQGAEAMADEIRGRAVDVEYSKGSAIVNMAIMAPMIAESIMAAPETGGATLVAAEAGIAALRASVSRLFLETVQKAATNTAMMVAGDLAVQGYQVFVKRDRSGFDGGLTLQAAEMGAISGAVDGVLTGAAMKAAPGWFKSAEGELASVESLVWAPPRWANMAVQAANNTVTNLAMGGIAGQPVDLESLGLGVVTGGVMGAMQHTPGAAHERMPDVAIPSASEFSAEELPSGDQWIRPPSPAGAASLAGGGLTEAIRSLPAADDTVGTVWYGDPKSGPLTAPVVEHLSGAIDRVLSTVPEDGAPPRIVLLQKVPDASLPDLRQLAADKGVEIVVPTAAVAVGPHGTLRVDSGEPGAGWASLRPDGATEHLGPVYDQRRVSADVGGGAPASVRVVVGGGENFVSRDVAGYGDCAVGSLVDAALAQGAGDRVPFGERLVAADPASVRLVRNQIADTVWSHSDDRRGGAAALVDELEPDAARRILADLLHDDGPDGHSGDPVADLARLVERSPLRALNRLRRHYEELGDEGMAQLVSYARERADATGTVPEHRSLIDYAIRERTLAETPLSGEMLGSIARALGVDVVVLSADRPAYHLNPDAADRVYVHRVTTEGGGNHYRSLRPAYPAGTAGGRGGPHGRIPRDQGSNHQRTDTRPGARVPVYRRVPVPVSRRGDRGTLPRPADTAKAALRRLAGGADPVESPIQDPVENLLADAGYRRDALPKSDGLEALAGPDVFGQRAVPQPPQFLAGYDFEALKPHQVAGFFDRFDMARERTGPPTPDELDPRLLPRSDADDGIPRVIHHIWMGSPVDDTGSLEEFQRNAAHGKRETGYTSVLWTDVGRGEIGAVRNAPDADLTPRQQRVKNMLSWAGENDIRLAAIDEVFAGTNKASLHAEIAIERSKRRGPGYATASDLLRLEILDRFGGVYTDGDNVVHASLGDRVKAVAATKDKFAVAVAVHEAKSADPGPAVPNSKFSVSTPHDPLTNSGFIATQGNPMVKTYLKTLRSRYALTYRDVFAEKSAKRETTEPERGFTTGFLLTSLDDRSEVITRTGPTSWRFDTLARTVGAANGRFHTIGPDDIRDNSRTSWIADGVRLEPERAEADASTSAGAGRPRPAPIPMPAREAVRASVSLLHRDLVNREGVLNLQVVRDVIGEVDPADQERVWKAVLRTMRETLPKGEIDIAASGDFLVATRNEDTKRQHFDLPAAVKDYLKELFPDAVIHFEVGKPGLPTRLIRDVRSAIPDRRPEAELHDLLVVQNAVFPGAIPGDADQLRASRKILADQLRASGKILDLLHHASPRTDEVWRGHLSKLHVRKLISQRFAGRDEPELDRLRAILFEDHAELVRLGRLTPDGWKRHLAYKHAADQAVARQRRRTGKSTEELLDEAARQASPRQPGSRLRRTQSMFLRPWQHINDLHYHVIDAHALRKDLFAGRQPVALRAAWKAVRFYRKQTGSPRSEAPLTAQDFAELRDVLAERHPEYRELAEDIHGWTAKIARALHVLSPDSGRVSAAALTRHVRRLGQPEARRLPARAREVEASNAFAQLYVRHFEGKPNHLLVLDRADSRAEQLVSTSRALPEEEGYFTVDAHGAEGAVLVGGRAVEAEELARAIADHPAWSGGEPIRLTASATGRDRDGFAQQLAEFLGVEVKAPTGTPWVSPEGDHFVSGIRYTEDGTVRPTDRDTGGWQIFSPDRATPPRPEEPGARGAVLTDAVLTDAVLGTPRDLSDADLGGGDPAQHAPTTQPTTEPSHEEYFSEPIELGGGSRGRLFVPEGESAGFRVANSVLTTTRGTFAHVEPGSSAHEWKVNDRQEVPWDPEGTYYVAEIHNTADGLSLRVKPGSADGGPDRGARAISRRDSLMNMEQDAEIILLSCAAALPGPDGIAPARKLADLTGRTVWAPTSDANVLAGRKSGFGLLNDREGNPGRWVKFEPAPKTETVAPVREHRQEPSATSPTPGAEPLGQHEPPQHPRPESGAEHVAGSPTLRTHETGQPATDLIQPPEQGQLPLQQPLWYFEHGVHGAFTVAGMPAWSDQTRTRDLETLVDALRGVALPLSEGMTGEIRTRLENAFAEASAGALQKPAGAQEKWQSLIRSGIQFIHEDKLVRLDLDFARATTVAAPRPEHGPDEYLVDFGGGGGSRGTNSEQSVVLDAVTSLVDTALNMAIGIPAHGMISIGVGSKTGSSSDWSAEYVSGRKNMSNTTARLSTGLRVKLSIDGVERSVDPGHAILHTDLPIDVPSLATTATDGDPRGAIENNVNQAAVKRRAPQILLAAIDMRRVSTELQRQMIQAGYSRKATDAVTRSAQESVFDESWTVNHGRSLLAGGALSAPVRVGFGPDGFEGRFKTRMTITGIQRVGPLPRSRMRDDLGHTTLTSHGDSKTSSLTITGGLGAASLHGVPNVSGSVQGKARLGSEREHEAKTKTEVANKTVLLRNTAQVRYRVTAQIEVDSFVDRGPEIATFSHDTVAEIDLPLDEATPFETAAADRTVEAAANAQRPDLQETDPRRGSLPAVPEDTREPFALRTRRGQGLSMLLDLPGSEDLVPALYKHLKTAVRPKLPTRAGLNGLYADLVEKYSTPSLEADLQPLLSGIPLRTKVDGIPVDVLVIGHLHAHAGVAHRPVSVNSRATETSEQSTARKKARSVEGVIGAGFEPESKPVAFNLPGATLTLRPFNRATTRVLAQTATSYRRTEAAGDGDVHTYKTIYEVQIRIGGKGKDVQTRWLSGEDTRARIAVPPQHRPQSDDGNAPSRAVGQIDLTTDTYTGSDCRSLLENARYTKALEFDGNAVGIYPTFLASPELIAAAGHAYQTLNGEARLSNHVWDWPAEIHETLNPTGLHATFDDQISSRGAVVTLPDDGGWHQTMVVRTRFLDSTVTKHHTEDNEGLVELEAYLKAAAVTGASKERKYGADVTVNLGLDYKHPADKSSSDDPASSKDADHFKAGFSIGGGVDRAKTAYAKHGSADVVRAAYGGEGYTVRATPHFEVTFVRHKGGYSKSETIHVVASNAVEFVATRERAGELGLTTASAEVHPPRTFVQHDIALASAYPEKLNAEHVPQALLVLLQNAGIYSGGYDGIERFVHTRYSVKSMRAHQLDLFEGGMLGWFPITDSAFGTRFLWTRLNARGGDVTFVGPRPDVELNLRSEVLTGSGEGGSRTRGLHAGLFELEGNGPVNGVSTLACSLLPVEFELSDGHSHSVSEADKDIYRYNTKNDGAVEFSRQVDFTVSYGVTTEPPEAIRLLAVGVKKLTFPISDLIIKYYADHSPFQDFWYAHRAGPKTVKDHPLLPTGAADVPGRGRLTLVVPKHLTLPVTDTARTTTIPLGPHIGALTWTRKGSPAPAAAATLGGAHLERLTKEIIPVVLPVAKHISDWIPSTTLKTGRDRVLLAAIAAPHAANGPTPPQVPELHLTTHAGLMAENDTRASALRANVAKLLRNEYAVSVRGKEIRVGLEITGARRITTATYKGRRYQQHAVTSASEFEPRRMYAIGDPGLSAEKSDVPQDGGALNVGPARASGSHESSDDTHITETNMEWQGANYAYYGMDVAVQITSPNGELRFTLAGGLHGMLRQDVAAAMEREAGQIFGPPDTRASTALQQRANMDARAMSAHEEAVQRAAQVRQDELDGLEQSARTRQAQVTNAKGELGDLSRKLDQARIRLDGHRHMLEVQEAEHAAADSVVRTATAELRASQSRLYERIVAATGAEPLVAQLKLTLDTARGATNLLDTRIQCLGEELDAARQPGGATAGAQPHQTQADALTAQLGTLNAERRRVADEITALDRQREEAVSTGEMLTAEIPPAWNKVQKAASDLEAAQKRAGEARDQVERSRGGTRLLEEEIQRSQTQKDQAARNLAAAEKHFARNGEAIEQLRQAEKVARAESDRLKANKTSSQTELEQYLERTEELDTAIAELAAAALASAEAQEAP